ncbi:MAG: type II toxin-antitoxin system mRNA interferase toxin, RelE/StbE family [Nitrospirae bacterium]|nr:type II toxin-antitoxin system mRNA interferase toxin, RelE/StbE family [Nitrospirota bacterium]
MKRKIEYSPVYLRQAKKIAKKYPHLKGTYTELIEKLSQNPFDPSVHTHALSGKLKGKHACSLTYDLRVICIIADESIHLLEIGSHDEVY